MLGLSLIHISLISSIYKKGNKQDCNNYRGISVTSARGRLDGRILKNKIEGEIGNVEEQSGFRAGRSCVDNIFSLRQIIEKRTERNLETHLVFVDPVSYTHLDVYKRQHINGADF